MNWYQDSTNVRSNQVTITGCSGPAYNAVVKVVFSAESAIYPVTLQQAKDWIRVDISDDDDLITALIKAATRICEKEANLSFITRTVKATLINGEGNINLPYGPTTGDITYTINDTDLTALENFDITSAYGSQIIATYTAGYASADLPEEYRTAIKCQIAWMYTNRGDEKLATSLSLESSLILNAVRIDS